MNRLEFPSLLVLPTIDALSSDIKQVYYIDYYDGPLEGLLTYLGKFYWFSNIWEDWEPANSEDEPSKRYRWFVLMEPTPEQLDFHNYWHEQFEHHKKFSTLEEFYGPYKEAKRPPFSMHQAKYLMIE